MATTADRSAGSAGTVVETDTPARLDRLPWSSWHWKIVIGLGAVWILDGLEVNFIGMISSRLSEPGSGLTISSGEAIAAGAVYVAGACFGALLFGHLTDRFGRKRLFMITLALYLTATILTGLSFSVVWFYVMRFLTGAGIGGEYAAINSAIDELIPARVRGTIDLWINGSFWFGTVLAGGISLLVLDGSLFAGNVGWRLGFAAGALLGLGILFVRRTVPESPRWLVIHGRDKEADKIVSRIEQEVLDDISDSELPKVDPNDTIKIEQRKSTSFIEIAQTILTAYPRRTVVGLALFAGQAFLYNAVVFAQAALLTTFFGISADQAPLYIIPFAAGNLLGPLLLGRLFDIVGRRPMIAGTYLLSGILLAISAFLFRGHTFGPWGLTAAWCVIFFFASAGASSAYLTVSEIFPMETRALAIALFYAVGTAIGGITGPLLFSKLVSSGNVDEVFWGYIVGAAMMVFGGLVEAFLGFDVEQQRLEQIAEPLSAVDESTGEHESTREEPASTRQPTTSARKPPPLRQRRLGPGTASGWSRSPLYAAHRDDHVRVEREMDVIVAALEAGGPQTRVELARRLAARHWGPGRFARALRFAQVAGRVRRSGRRFWATPGGAARRREAPSHG